MHCHQWKHFCKGSLSASSLRVTSLRPLKLLQIFKWMKCGHTSWMLMIPSLQKSPHKPRYRNWKDIRTFYSTTAKCDTTCSVWRIATFPHASVSLQDCQENSLTTSTICHTQYQMVTTTRTLNICMKRWSNWAAPPLTERVRRERQWNALHSNCKVCQKCDPHYSVSCEKWDSKTTLISQEKMRSLVEYS